MGRFEEGHASWSSETGVVKSLPASAGASSQVLHVGDARAATSACLDISREFHPVIMP